MNSLKEMFRRFFYGRRGADQLGMAVLLFSVILSLFGSIFASGILSLLSTAAWVYVLFRMLSRNIPAREKENRLFMAKYTGAVMRFRQARTRFKNRKIYLYYRCPNCRAWLRLPRNAGEKTVTCGKCSATFKKKA